MLTLKRGRLARARSSTGLRRAGVVAAVLALGALLAAPPVGATAEDGTTAADVVAPTPGDLMTITEGVSVEAELEALADDAAASLGDRWGGGWVNPDGTITIAVTDAAASAIPLHPKVRVVTVRHSTTALTASHRRIVERLNALLAPGVEPGTSARWPYVSGVSNKDNIVKVTVDELHRERSTEIDEALADERASNSVAITYGTVPVGENNCGTRAGCTAPFRGGTQVVGTTPPNEACTLAFVMKDHVGRRLQSTAGHCGGSPWQHGGRAIGPTRESNGTRDWGNVDALVIRQNNQAEPAPTNWVYRPNNTATAITTKIHNPDGTLEGINVCIEGVVTGGTSCGAINDWAASYNGRCCFGRIAVNACRGDSGAPVLNQTTNKAYGIHKGGFNLLEGDQCTTFGTVFTWLRYAEDQFGVTLLDRSTSQTLAAGQQMPAGYALVSPNGAYNLQMQSDGNLVLYNCCGTWLWQTRTNGNWGALAVMQNDGNLVVYSAAGVPLWNRPWGGWVAGSYLELQDDNNLVIYTESRGVTWHRKGPNP